MISNRGKVIYITTLKVTTGVAAVGINRNKTYNPNSWSGLPTVKAVEAE